MTDYLNWPWYWLKKENDKYETFIKESQETDQHIVELMREYNQLFATKIDRL